MPSRSVYDGLLLVQNQNNFVLMHHIEMPQLLTNHIRIGVSRIEQRHLIGQRAMLPLQLLDICLSLIQQMQVLAPRQQTAGACDRKAANE